jgi:hypothetical protein
MFAELITRPGRHHRPKPWRLPSKRRESVCLALLKGFRVGRQQATATSWPDYVGK